MYKSGCVTARVIERGSATSDDTRALLDGLAAHKRTVELTSLTFCVCLGIISLLVSCRVFDLILLCSPWLSYPVAALTLVGYFLLVSSQSTTNTVPFCFLGCFYNDCPWMVGQAFNYELSEFLAVISVIGQLAITTLPLIPWLILTLAIGLVVMPHAGLLSDVWD